MMTVLKLGRASGTRVELLDPSERVECSAVDNEFELSEEGKLRFWLLLFLLAMLPLLSSFLPSSHTQTRSSPGFHEETPDQPSKNPPSKPTYENKSEQRTAIG